MKRILMVAFTTVLAAGCASQPRYNYAPELIGGTVGAVVGSHFGKGTGRLVTTAVGTVVGVVVGKEIAESNNGAPGRGGTKTVINQKEDYCVTYPTEGEVVACERGIAERKLLIQRQREQNAYNRGKARGALSRLFLRQERWSGG